MRVKFDPWIIFLFGLVTGLILSQTLQPRAIFASTEYETEAPIQKIYLSQTGGCCSGPDNYTEHFEVIRLPIGTSFNNIQLSGTSTTDVPMYVYLMQDVGPTFESATGTNPSDPLNNDVILATLLVDDRAQQISEGVLQSGTFATTTITAANQYIHIIYAGSGGFTFTRNFQTKDGYSYNLNTNFTYSLRKGSTAKRFCLGPCEDLEFDISTIVNASNFNIAIFDPDYGTTTPTTTVFLNAFFLYDGFVSTTTKAEILVYDYFTNDLEFTFSQFIPPDIDISFTLSTTTILQSGSKNMVARYVQASNNAPLMPQKEVFFSVVDNTYLAATGLNNPQSTAGELTQIDCDTFDVGCQFQKALTFLFVPSQNVLDRFTGLWQDLRTVPPFGYAFISFDYLNGLDSLAIGAYSFPDVPFKTAIFDPINDALGFLLWGVFAFAFYNNRVKKFDI